MTLSLAFSITAVNVIFPFFGEPNTIHWEEKNTHRLNIERIFNEIIITMSATYTLIKKYVQERRKEKVKEKRSSDSISRE